MNFPILLSPSELQTAGYANLILPGGISESLILAPNTTWKYAGCIYRCLAIEIIFGTFTLWLLVEIIKALWNRDRPFLALFNERVIGWREKGDSFPSGQTAQIFFLTRLLIHYFRFGIIITAAL